MSRFISFVLIVNAQTGGKAHLFNETGFCNYLSPLIKSVHLILAAAIANGELAMQRILVQRKLTVLQRY